MPMAWHPWSSTPRPEGGRIVYASRIPPRPNEGQRLGGFVDWMGTCIREVKNINKERVCKNFGGEHVFVDLHV